MASENRMTLHLNSMEAFHALFEHTSGVVRQLQQHLGPAQINEQVHTRELIVQLNQILRNQHAINNLQFALAQQNHFANMATFAKTKQLSDVIKRGQKEIVILTRTITILKETIASLNLDIESQRLEAERLEKGLKHTQETLEHCIEEYRAELEAQRRLLEEQGKQLQHLLHHRVKTDFLVDFGSLIVCFVGIRLSMLKHWTEHMIRVLPKRMRRISRWMMELVLLYQVFGRMRTIFIQTGLHSQMGNLHEYLRMVMKLVI